MRKGLLWNKNGARKRISLVITSLDIDPGLCRFLRRDVEGTSRAGLVRRHHEEDRMDLLARVRAAIQSVVVQSGEDVSLPSREEDTVNPPPREDFLVIQAGPWPADLSLRRENIYDEWER